jgi:hypothetical protein
LKTERKLLINPDLALPATMILAVAFLIASSVAITFTGGAVIDLNKVGANILGV